MATSPRRVLAQFVRRGQTFPFDGNAELVGENQDRLQVYKHGRKIVGCTGTLDGVALEFEILEHGDGTVCVCDLKGKLFRSRHELKLRLVVYREDRPFSPREANILINLTTAVGKSERREVKKSRDFARSRDRSDKMQLRDWCIPTPVEEHHAELAKILEPSEVKVLESLRLNRHLIDA